MAAINTLVDKSENIRAAALNLNAKAYELRQTIAGVWDLKPSAPEAPAEAMSLDMKNDTDESVNYDDDQRVMVHEQHFMPGGKYRSIVKLFIHYEFQKPGRYAMGTGWLISPSIFVTAGHCSYDWSHNLGRATEVKAYVGYHGRDSVKGPNVQFRTVKRIVTTKGWLTQKGMKSYDVSFMQVNKAFNGITPIKYMETPQQGELTLGVVGYPGDLKDMLTGEAGAHMYEMFLPTKFNLSMQVDTMLEYRIDTFGGNSGSPVLVDPGLYSIGAHVYGGTINSANSASVIGRFGNPFGDYINAFGVTLSNAGLNLVQVKAVSTQSASISSQPPTGGSRLQGGSNGYSKLNGSAGRELTVPAISYGAESTEEGFLDFLKSAMRVGAPIAGRVLNAGLSVALGPLGGPLGALAGCALNAAGKLAESMEAESGFDAGSSGLDAATIQEGSMERAVLAEAAFTAVQQMNLSPDEQESIFSDMKAFVVRSAPTVRKVAPKIMGAMMEPALRIALNALHNYNQTDAGTGEAFEDQTGEPFRMTYTTDIATKRGNRQTEDFVQGVKDALTHGQESLDDDSAEGFFDFVSVAAKFVVKGLPIIVGLLAEAGEAESTDTEAAPSVPGLGGLSGDDLAKRAIVGEAALQAIMKLPKDRLEEEGFFDIIADVIKTVAPVVVKVAPAVISNIFPVMSAIFKNSGQESFEKKQPALSRFTPTRKSSTLSLRSKNGANDFLSNVKEWHQSSTSTIV